MRVALVRRRRVIAPFGLDVDACGLGMDTFGAYRARMLGALGFVEADVEETAEDVTVDGPALVLADDVWITQRALGGFAKAAALSAAGEATTSPLPRKDAGDGATSAPTFRLAGPLRMCLPRSRLLELFLPLQDVDVDAAGRAAFDVGYVPVGARAKPRDLFGLGPERWCEAPYKDVPLDVPVPRYILGRDSGSMRFPLTSTVAMRIRHWLHVLRAGHLMPQVALLERATAEPVRSVLRTIASARFTKAQRMRALRANFAYRGKNTFVHPTATVEASILGDDVTVGAYSYVTNSVVGDGSVIEQRAQVSGCSLGPRTFVSLNSSLQACVAFGDTDACINGVQACVIAQRCALTSFARPLDLAVDGPVKVEDDGKLRDAGELPCGVAFGPGVFAGADVVIAAGRAIPAGVRLYVDADRVLRRVPADLKPGKYAVVDGKPLE